MKLKTRKQINAQHVEELTRLCMEMNDLINAENKESPAPWLNEMNAKSQEIFKKILAYSKWSLGEHVESNSDDGHTVKELERLKSRVNYYKTLYEKGFEISAETDVNRLLDIALDAVIQITGAERGFIALLNEDQTFEVQAARAIDEKEIRDPQSQISKTIMKEVIELGNKFEAGDLQTDPHYGVQSSIIRLNLQSVLCLPLTIDNRVFGAIYMDNNSSQNAFSTKSLAVLTTFAGKVSQAVSNAIHLRELENSHDTLIKAASDQLKFREIIGGSTAIQKLLIQLLQVAPTNATVLLLGESGTGKELMARALHENSGRAENTFTTINCSAIPANLLESELFGHEKGAFTGATARKTGKFESADGGTLFLDEIGDMELALQSKLLRVIQNMEVQPLGSNETKKVDIRIVAATNKNLKEMVAEKKFREDLYYRLNVFAIKMPPLRQRKEDIPALVYYFLEKYKKQHNKIQIHKVSAEVFEILTDYHWPGNIRELENVIERAVILCQENALNYSHLPPEIATNFHAAVKDEERLNGGFEEMVNAYKRRLLLRVLEEKGENMSEVARALNLNRSYLYRLLGKLGIQT